MHVAVAWDIKNPVTKERQDEITKSLREVFVPWRWISPVSGFHVVRIDTAEDREKLQTALVEKVKAVPEGVHFVVSPAMPSGSNYNGWLPKDWWPKLRDRTS